MDYDLWQRLGTNSRRAILRTKKRAYRGRKLGRYRYSPRGDLLENLSQETGRSVEQCKRDLLKLRKALLKEQGLD